MAEVQIGNAFVSAKPDSVDSSIVSSSEWNADFLFKNGADGQIPVRDATQVTGARWTEGPRVVRTDGSTAGGTTSPALAPSAITFTSNVLVTLTVYVVATTSAAQNITFTLRRNTVSLGAALWFGTGISGVILSVVQPETPGTYTYDVIASVASGTITTAAVALQAQIVGT